MSSIKEHKAGKNFFIRIILYGIPAICFITMISGCGFHSQLDVYEKHVTIPGYSWNYNFHPSFSVYIKDTAATYSIFVTIRNSNDYAFSNIWLLISSGKDSEKPKVQRVELPLADKEGRWLGSGMDGIYDHRIPIQEHARFDKSGAYNFSFEQNMRTNPLPHIMSVGLRIEKISR